MFNKVKKVVVFSTGDNKFDENGNYKKNNFSLNDKEIECLNWFINNVNIEDYKKEILKYCNNEYSMCSDIQIAEQEICYLSADSGELCQCVDAVGDFAAVHIAEHDAHRNDILRLCLEQTAGAH